MNRASPNFENIHKTIFHKNQGFGYTNQAKLFLIGIIMYVDVTMLIEWSEIFITRKSKKFRKFHRKGFEPAACKGLKTKPTSRIVTHYTTRSHSISAKLASSPNSKKRPNCFAIFRYDSSRNSNNRN